MHVYQGSRDAAMEILKSGKDLIIGCKRMSMGFKVDYRVKVDYDAGTDEGIYVALDGKSKCVHMRNFYKNADGELRPGGNGCSVAPGEFITFIQTLPEYVPLMNFVEYDK